MNIGKPPDDCLKYKIRYSAKARVFRLDVYAIGNSGPGLMRLATASNQAASSSSLEPLRLAVASADHAPDANSASR
jgi:hypothetical protein